MEAKGCFISNVTDETTPEQLLELYSDLRELFTLRQMTSCLNFFKQAISIHRKHEDQCWGGVVSSLSTLDDHHHTVLRMEDRIGAFDGFQGWQKMRSLQQRQMLATRCGLMMLIDLEDGTFLFLVLAHRSEKSVLYRLMTHTTNPMTETSMDDILERIHHHVKHYTCIPYFFSNQPWFDAMFNASRGIYDEDGAGSSRLIPVRAVCGSLGMTMHPEFTWYEYGDPSWTSFVQFKSPAMHIDAHFWTEDDQGRVYDVARDLLRIPLLSNGIRLPKESFPWAIHGKTKDELKNEYGLVYVPAPVETQTLILTSVRRLNPGLDEMCRRT